VLQAVSPDFPLQPVITGRYLRPRRPELALREPAHLHRSDRVPGTPPPDRPWPVTGTPSAAGGPCLTQPGGPAPWHRTPQRGPITAARHTAVTRPLAPHPRPCQNRHKAPVTLRSRWNPGAGKITAVRRGRSPFGAYHPRGADLGVLRHLGTADGGAPQVPQSLLMPAWLCPSPGRGGTWLWFRRGCCRARPGGRSDQVFLRRA
jgi:hypothetical protein